MTDEEQIDVHQLRVDFESFVRSRAENDQETARIARETAREAASARRWMIGVLVAVLSGFVLPVVTAGAYIVQMDSRIVEAQKDVAATQEALGELRSGMHEIVRLREQITSLRRDITRLEATMSRRSVGAPYPE